MGRPLNSIYFGAPGTGKCIMLSAAWIPGAPSASSGTVYILQQKGSNSYQVTDGTYTGVVLLVPSGTLSSGQGQIIVNGFTSAANGVGATFTATYGAYSATATTGGTGYVVNDSITLPNGTILHVSSVSSGAITGLTVATAGTYTNVQTAINSGITQVSTTGVGTGAVFSLTFKLVSVSSTGGTGYTVGETLTFADISATVLPTATIASVTSGAPATFTITGGTYITAADNGISVTATTTTEHAYVIEAHTVKTYEDNIYAWSLTPASQVGQANLPFA